MFGLGRGPSACRTARGVAALAVILSIGCRSVDDESVSRGGQTDSHAAKGNDQVGRSASPDGEEQPSTSSPHDAGAAIDNDEPQNTDDCAGTIHCGSGGMCSCVSGVNSGKECDQDSGECASLCGKC